jgi:hypothetical protein
MAKLFFSYSHKDESLRDQLEIHLAMLKRQGFIETWHDRRIVAGQPLSRTISANLDDANVILLLVSPDFLASDYCYDQEMLRAMERHKAGLATVIPVICRPCDWHDAPFGKLLACPKDGRPITQWPDIDSAFLDVTTAIKAALSKRRGATGEMVSPARTQTSGIQEKISEPRSSNLRVAKRFNDWDRDQFRMETFEYIAKFFENSLAELSRRNSDVSGKFLRLDAARFTAVAYRNGKAISRCSIFMDTRTGSAGSIAYSNNDSGTTNSFNESLSVANDDQTLFMRPLGMSRFHRNGQEEKLTQEGSAELFWELLIEPLQRN